MNIKPYLIFIVILINGCAAIQQQQRPDSTPCIEKEVTASKCGASSYVSLEIDRHEEVPIIAFMEFNIEGVPFDKTNIDNVLARIESLSAENYKNLLMVAFIHGWHHNAAQTDRNVIEFKKFLLELQREEHSLAVGTPRSVV